MHELLRDLLLVAAVGLTVAVVTVVAGAIALAWSLRRRLRLAPQLPCSAPLLWLWSPSTAARLHRRLRRAVRLAQSATMVPARRSQSRRRRRGGEHPLADVAADLVGQAAALDDELVSVHRLPAGPRRAAVRRLARRIVSVETAAVRLAQLAWPGRGGLEGSGLAGSGLAGSGLARGESDPLRLLTERLDLLAQARADLDRIGTVSA